MEIKCLLLFFQQLSVSHSTIALLCSGINAFIISISLICSLPISKATWFLRALTSKNCRNCWHYLCTAWHDDFFWHMCIRHTHAHTYSMSACLFIHSCIKNDEIYVFIHVWRHATFLSLHSPTDLIEKCKFEQPENSSLAFCILSKVHVGTSSRPYHYYFKWTYHI